jgi:hypothetical protein
MDFKHMATLVVPLCQPWSFGMEQQLAEKMPLLWTFHCLNEQEKYFSHRHLEDFW